MKKHTNLTVFLILVGLLLASICSLIWQVKRSLAEAPRAQEELNVAPVPAAPREEPQPLPPVPPKQTAVTLPPAEEAPAPSPILSNEELLQLAKQDLAPFFPPDQLEEMAKRTQNIVLYPMVIAAGTKIIHAKYPKTDPTLEQTRTEQIKALQRTVFDIRKRIQKNDLLKKRVPPEEQKNWLEQSPLHRKNISIAGPKGQTPLRRITVSCPPWQKDYDLCEQVFYSKNEFSLFLFKNDILLSREDYQAPKKLSAGYMFFPPNPYKSGESAAGQELLQGRVSYCAHWDSTHPLPLRESRYRENGLLQQNLTRNFEENTQQTIFYDEKGQFTQLDISSISTTGRAKLPQSLAIMSRKYASPTASFASEGSYRKDVSAHASGRWTASPDGTVTLDEGRRFPPAQSFPRAPLYRDIYPAQVPAAQTAPELL
ncbi:hypothetical protein [Candidatus Avelusimicrobium gallicola]|uniref:Uncharacterized protein n=1 Tax=Candidatus Avelusimicrobium gallicola TaxID=2562704 RepID=A0A1Y4DE13_9BACT|nr:hypothetical protein [Elusimicrobium sp. An273]OUO56892.1 hypothetical protein B5F75_03345 [Elusimicrobium sp. An273]